MKDYNKVESCLKSFLKNNKRLSYSMALLISFLINGGFSYADEAIQVPLRTEIKTRIEKEQENISQMLKEADESTKRHHALGGTSRRLRRCNVALFKESRYRTLPHPHIKQHFQQCRSTL